MQTTLARVPAMVCLLAAAGCGHRAPITDGGTGPVSDLSVGAGGSIDLSSSCAGVWSVKASMGTPRLSLALAPVTIGGVTGVLAVGGGNCTNPYLSTAEFFNPTTGSWTPVISMTTPRDQVVAAPVTLNGVAGVLAAGGTASATNYLSSAEFFNPNTGGWTPVQPMTTARATAAAAPVTIGGVTGVLVVGGHNCCADVYLATTEFFDPTANTWTPMASMSIPRPQFAGSGSGAAAAVIYGGVAGVLVASGSNDGTSAEFFNPNTNSWTSVNPMGTVRRNIAASAVTIGGVAGVLVSGGSNNGVFLSSAEFFNPNANGWLPVAPIPTTHLDHGAAPLIIDGRTGVLVAGGSGTGSCTIQSDAEFYCP